ncbi:pyridoxal-phosphate dependent enzyme [Brenneria izadpanahii]|uniref:Pyridoxal-phosphate dependent enzyme n=1 Tax=Brenneria izadpanahii TaxID=2722756 RepID=A0ABX7UQH9_9GAMM|nr:pyridoxal-phosphate dependent enzyme [Brenneria izadpanahii]QTF07560.1 pyridoxal-phosphate dependent enzyme [Brenneria izadpanahii]
MINFISSRSIAEAAERLSGAVIRTPAVFCPALTDKFQRTVYLKLENMQIGGSFKARGVLNLFSALGKEMSEAKFVAVSGGNFGIAIGEAARTFGADVTVIMPRSAPSSSVKRIRDTGSVVIVEDDVNSAFARARELEEKGYRVIDDCRDTLIAEGHGTLGLEFIADCPSLTDVIVAVGGGAMLAGVATALKSIKPEIRVWGVETAGASSMYQALQAGKPTKVDISSIISTLGVPVIDELMLAHAQRYVEEIVVVSDDDAINGMISFGEAAKQWVELASGALLPAAAAISMKVPESAVIGLVVCGGNISHQDMNKWLTFRQNS